MSTLNVLLGQRNQNVKEYTNGHHPSSLSREKWDACHFKILNKIWLLMNTSPGLNMLRCCFFSRALIRGESFPEKWQGKCSVLDSTRLPKSRKKKFPRVKTIFTTNRKPRWQTAAKRKHLSVTSDRVFAPCWRDWREMSLDVLSPQGISRSDVTGSSCDDSPVLGVIARPPPTSRDPERTQLAGANDIEELEVEG